MDFIFGQDTIVNHSGYDICTLRERHAGKGIDLGIRTHGDAETSIFYER